MVNSAESRLLFWLVLWLAQVPSPSFFLCLFLHLHINSSPFVLQDTVFSHDKLLSSFLVSLLMCYGSLRRFFSSIDWGGRACLGCNILCTGNWCINNWTMSSVTKQHSLQIAVCCLSANTGYPYCFYSLNFKNKSRKWILHALVFFW